MKKAMMVFAFLTVILLAVPGAPQEEFFFDAKERVTGGVSGDIDGNGTDDLLVFVYDMQKQKHFNKMTGQWEIIETMPMANSILPRTNQTQQPTNYAQKLRNAKQKEKYDIYIKEKRKQQWLPILVLETFTSPRPEGMQASHLNGIGTDNKLSNLAWESNVDNNNRKYEHGTMRGAHKGEKHSNCKLKDITINEIRKNIILENLNN